ncbi:low molecular weight protein-tyrosine-phosphatase [Thermomonas sp.]|jgi:protein-tyrosine phosphatase|uniref:low molecular weight protein-tyrosine-phosphatase n=1 Tax=Thermomonas sp. TaxID=1971895 RepID=UPI001AC7B486|nr:low molecular weight phosphotyrosine protein phosphatase [Xanthomonadales bacterium]MBN8795867.1 low molecular weight phosphotyrosine protein phosphatase [Stenotrophomonas nitritireducens]
MARPFSILMLCLGNICRSPTAEGVLRARLQAAGLDGRVHVDSAGTGDSHLGQAPDPRAIACAAGHGVDISMLRARRLALEDFDAFDLILCADRTILHEARIRKPRTSHAQVELLLDWAGQGKKDVPDPYYGTVRDFEHAFRLIDAAAQGIVERVRQGRF